MIGGHVLASRGIAQVNPMEPHVAMACLYIFMALSILTIMMYVDIVTKNESRDKW
jgi:hypothetical protein